MMKTWIFILLMSLTMQSQQASDARVEVFFDFNEHVLNDSAIRTINDFIAEGKDVEVSKIYGFCDWVGSNSYNDTLSLKRVASVHEYLQNKGIKVRKDYEKKGFGEDFTQSEIQSENRKVLIIFNEIERPIPRPSSKTLAEQVKGAVPGDKIKLENINFHNNSATILPKSKPALYDLLCVLEENPKLKVEIQGHICCQPLNDKNDVSTARARAIYNFLIRNKIDRKRLSFKGFGVTRPLYKIPERTEEEAVANRRVEIMIVEN